MRSVAYAALKTLTVESVAGSSAEDCVVPACLGVNTPLRPIESTFHVGLVYRVCRSPETPRVRPG